MFSRMISVVGGGEERESGRQGESAARESATTMLKAEHDEVRRLFKEFEGASENARSSRKRIADEVSQKLDVHAQLEEKIFYPACRSLEDEEARKMVGESLEEHLIVKRLIAELAPLDASDETFESKFTVLKENVEHHADEEERDLFPVAEKELGDERLEEIGAELARMKQRLLSGARGSRSGGGSSPRRSSGSRGGQARGRSSERGRSGGSQGSRSRSTGSRGGSSSRSRSSGSSGGSKRSSGSRGKSRPRSSSSGGSRSQSKRK